MQSVCPPLGPESSTLQRQWASHGARTPIPSTQAVPISGFARIQQAPVNTVSQSITAKLVSHHGVELPASVLQCGAARNCDPAQRGTRTPRIRLHPYRRRASSRQHVSLFTVGDEADKKETAAIATAADPSRATSSHRPSVSTTRRLNSFFQKASCTHSSFYAEVSYILRT